MKLSVIQGGVLAAGGFLGAAVKCGLKPSGAPDLVLLWSDRPAAGAAVFTQNKLCAAPVKVSRRRIRGGKLRAIVVNSGNANACTGKQGIADALAMAAAVAKALRIPVKEVGVASTGVIGHRLDMAKVQRGIAGVIPKLARTPQAARDVARAIMTTDTLPKSVAIQRRIGGVHVRVGGIAKGVGMIAPRLGHATMLVFISTDANVPAPLLRKCLNAAADATFNRITVDGDTSTNDSVFLMANGAAGGKAIRAGSREAGRFREALTYVCDDLSRRLVADGEGATKFIEIRVAEAASDADAEKAARAIAQSLLFKAAMYGRDPNWGRIVCATGYSGARVVEEKLRISMGGVKIVSKGAPLPIPKKELARIVAGRNILVEVGLGLGKGCARILTCDLSHEYVNINARYTT